MGIKKKLSEFWNDAPAYRLIFALAFLVMIPVFGSVWLSVFFIAFSLALWPARQIARLDKFITEEPQPNDIPTTVIVDSPPLHVPDAAIDVRQVSIKSDGIGGFYTTGGQI